MHRDGIGNWKLENRSWKIENRKSKTVTSPAGVHFPDSGSEFAVWSFEFRFSNFESPVSKCPICLTCQAIGVNITLIRATGRCSAVGARTNPKVLLRSGAGGCRLSVGRKMKTDIPVHTSSLAEKTGQGPHNLNGVPSNFLSTKRRDCALSRVKGANL